MSPAAPRSDLEPDASDATAADPHSTSVDEPTRGWVHFDQGLRTVAFVVVFGVVVAALLGLTERTRTVTTSNDDVALTVTYAQVTRPGIATPFEIEIATVGSASLPEEVTVEVPSDYLAMFDKNGLLPEPDGTSSDGTTEMWTFRPGGGSSLHIDFDGRLQPDAHSGRTATVRVHAQEIEPVAAQFRTWVLS